MKDPEFYVNGINRDIFSSARNMRNFNARYLEQLTSTPEVMEFAMRSNLNAMSIPEIKNQIQQIIGPRVNQYGRMPILCRDGKTRFYDPESWSETQARTQSRALQEEGLHHEMAGAGFDLVIVSIGGSGDMCRTWEGRILSIDGQTPGYQTIAEARSIHLFHPRCVHTTSPFIIAGGEEQEVWGRDRITPETRAQLKAQGNMIVIPRGQIARIAARGMKKVKPETTTQLPEKGQSPYVMTDKFKSTSRGANDAYLDLLDNPDVPKDIQGAVLAMPTVDKVGRVSGTCYYMQPGTHPKAGGLYFDRRRNWDTLKKDSTMLHELGHKFDFETLRANPKWGTQFQRDITAAIQRDHVRYEKQLKALHPGVPSGSAQAGNIRWEAIRAKNKELMELYRKDPFGMYVADTFEAVSAGDVGMGHGRRYFQDTSHRVSETVANLFTLHARKKTKMLKMIKDQWPDTYDTFFQYLGKVQ